MATSGSGVGRPSIEERAAEAEAERRLSSNVYRAMVDAGLFTMLAPQKYGGLELPILDVLDVWETVARIDSATAWNLVMNRTFGDMAAFLPDEGARELFSDGPTTVAAARIGAARDTLHNAAAAAYEEAESQLLSWDAKVRLPLAVRFAAEPVPRRSASSTTSPARPPSASNSPSSATAATPT
jgi:hypothetical protein